MEKLREGLVIPVVIQISSVDTEEGIVSGIVRDSGSEVHFPVSDARLGVLLTGMEDGGYLKATASLDGSTFTLSNFQAAPSVDKKIIKGDLPGMFHPHRGSRNHRRRH